MPDVIRILPKQMINVVPAGAGVAAMKEQYGRSLQILLAVCGLVLLIACANVANLLLARAVARRAQTARPPGHRRHAAADRLAGAHRERPARRRRRRRRSCGADGRRTSAAGTRVRSAPFLPISTRPSLAVLGFAFALALLTGIVFGAAPAWFATRTDPVDALRGAGRTTSDHSSFTRQALLVVQATLSVVLVAGATMLARSLNKLEHQDFGYQVRGRVVVA